MSRAFRGSDDVSDAEDEEDEEEARIRALVFGKGESSLLSSFGAESFGAEAKAGVGGATGAESGFYEDFGGDVDDVDDGTGAAVIGGKGEGGEGAPAWVDDDDAHLKVDIAAKNRLKKLRETREERELTGPEFEQRLRSRDGAAAEATADGSSPASAMDVVGHNHVGASGFHQTNITPLLSGHSNIDSTVNILQSIVNKDIAKLDSGEIAELSPQTMELMSRLVSLASSQSTSSSPTASVQQQETSAPSLAQAFAQVSSPKSKCAVITPQDVKEVPRLTGSAEVDVISLRCLEAANLTGSNTGRTNVHVSAMSFITVPNRTAITQYDAISLRAASSSAGSSSGGSGSRGSGSGGPKGKKVDGWLEECWTLRREERDARRTRATSKRNKSGGGGNGGGKRSKKPPAPDDEDDDN
eukprot:jgi/Undpi1/12743/HiC_scaffold_6.g02411.m1